MESCAGHFRGGSALRAAERASRNLSAILQSSLAVADTTKTIVHEWLDFARERAENNLSRMDSLFRCRTPQEFVVVQGEAVRDNLEGSLRWTRRIAERSIPIADEAMKKFSEGLERTASVAGAQSSSSWARQHYRLPMTPSCEAPSCPSCVPLKGRLQLPACGS